MRMHYVSYEEDRAWPTTGKGRHKHPFQEAAQVEQRLRDLAAPFYDEFLLLHFIATNEAPFVFSWVDQRKTEQDYGAVLARVSTLY
jgi:hypothetical protein